MDQHLSPTIQRLRSFPKDNKRRNYPKGTRQPLTKELAQRFCDLISTSLVSTSKLLADNPDFPTFKTLESWKRKFPWFNSMWTQARQSQAEFLMQHCLDLAIATEPKTAHVTRVRFDVYRFLASKFHPDVYGDKSQHGQQSTTVNVGIAIGPERLNDLRVKLGQSRSGLLPKPAVNSHKHDESRVSLLRNASNGERVSHTPVKDMKRSTTDMQSVGTPKT